MTVTAVDERLLAELVEMARGALVFGAGRGLYDAEATDLIHELADALDAALKEIAGLRDGLAGTRPYVLDVVNHGGGIENCEIGDRLELEWIDRLLAGGNSNE